MPGLHQGKSLTSKSFVCCTSGETRRISLIRSWDTLGGDPDMYETVRIWEAARATSAASSFFDPISIGEPAQRFHDGGTGANNPVRHVWNEATDLLLSEEILSEKLGCLLSIGTGQPSYEAMRDTVKGIGEALLAIATETEATANEFLSDKRRLFDQQICFRFSVPNGLGKIGLAETDQISAIRGMTGDYLQLHDVKNNIRICGQRLGDRQCMSEFA